ncbi:hypothetical protein EV356DRAFT_514593 [Viridothelium virens]|uniref:Something about silencing protein 4 domain-containing protein n=1 Tax=Viridothelium virens TaxID=1048519 RepID=A0A6A6HAV8_VIRVR|nr:hypothetical protein EV356DRAFT_514593 [Viridothelium virens]
MVHLRSSTGQTAELDAEHVAAEATRPKTTKRGREPDQHSNSPHNGPPTKAPRLQLSPSKHFSKPLRKRNVAHESSHASHEGPPPPTKVSVSQPHASLLQTTNGVRSTLNVRDDDISTQQSQVSTPSVEETVAHAQKRAGSRNVDKRSLRSHDGGCRLKSELSIYFPGYDEIITDAPIEDDIYVIDEPQKVNKSAQSDTPQPKASPSSRKPKSKGAASHFTNGTDTSPSRRLSAQYNGAQVVDFSTIDRNTTHNMEDPLSDAVYFKAHRRAERKEKQLRNIEKERAMHEKVQLERLLEGLRGYDWLKVMGITGVTESEAKKFEPKRNYFISEVKALVDKFRIWKEEEKRLKAEKEQAQQAREEAEEEDDQEEGDVASSGEPPSSEIDASAARQLQLEAFSATEKWPRLKFKLSAPDRHPSPEKPFTSFYAKSHLRDTALGKNRHGRTTFAFGHPLPELEEREFSLPKDYLTPEAITAAQRKRRRLKRQGKTV